MRLGAVEPARAFRLLIQNLVHDPVGRSRLGYQHPHAFEELGVQRAQAREVGLGDGEYIESVQAGHTTLQPVFPLSLYCEGAARSTMVDMRSIHCDRLKLECEEQQPSADQSMPPRRCTVLTARAGGATTWLQFRVEVDDAGGILTAVTVSSDPSATPWPNSRRATSRSMRSGVTPSARSSDAGHVRVVTCLRSFSTGAPQVRATDPRAGRSDA